MMDINSSLKELGFSENEIVVYKYLLRKGLTAGSQIYKEIQMDKSSCYKAINTLQVKNLVYSVGEKRNQKFNAYETQNLRDILANKQREFEQVKNNIDKFIEDINIYAKEYYKSSRIRIFEGVEGYKIFMNDLISGKVEVIRQLGPLERRISYIDNFYDYIEGHIEKRVERGIKARALFDITVKSDHLDKTRPDILKEARQVQESLGLEASIATFGDRVGFYTEQDGNFTGAIIKDQLVTNLMNSMYDFMWHRSKNV